MLRISNPSPSSDATAEDTSRRNFAPLDLGAPHHSPTPSAGGSRPDLALSDQALINHPLGGRTPDQLAGFAPMITAVRLVTVAIGLMLAAPGIIAGDLRATAAAVIVTGYSTLRVIRPITSGTAGDVTKRLAVEGLLFAAIVASTGFWASPFVFTLLTTIVIAGFAQGFGYAIQGAAILTIALSVPHVSRSIGMREAFSLSATWTALFFLIAVVAGVGRKMSGQADRERDLALDRLGRLADANALLYSLHQVAQTLPSSLDMDDVVISTVSRLRELLEFDAIAILLFDETTGDWDIIRQEGCHLPARLTGAGLPPGMRRALTTAGVVRCDFLGGIDGEGLSDRSGSALYAALTARGATTGLIAVERRGNQSFDHRAANLLAGFVPPLAMALDNARWFSRLRTVGANEERNRIARDLHDRIGQSLAYLAFELDRLINRSRQNQPVDDALEQLREDLRGVVREVRDTLYDLRTDVSERVPLDDTLTEFAQRVQERSGIAITVDAEATGRLPLIQEREMWRIAQEALTNVERHSRATEARVSWCYDGDCAVIRIRDNGIGFEIGQSGRLDSYGMLGMRERASSIGATLEVHSTPGGGTSVTCVLDPSDHPSRSLDRSLPGVRT